MIHFPNACNCLEWTRPQPAAQNSIQVSRVGGRRAKHLGPHLLPPSVLICRKLGWRQSWKSNPGVLIGDVDSPNPPSTSGSLNTVQKSHPRNTYLTLNVFRFIYLKELQREIDGETERDLSSTNDQKLLWGLPHGFTDPSTWTICCFPRP